MFTQGKAILIGVNVYSNPNIDQLPCVENDVNTVATILSDKNYCAYSPENVKVLAGSQANLSNIRNAFKELESSTESTVFIYFSGHGGRTGSGNRSQVYLCPTETAPGDLDCTAISGDEFSQLLKSISAQKLVVVLDACHAGGAKIKTSQKGWTWKAGIPSSYYEPLGRGNGRVLILSSKEDQFSYTKGELSLFTHYLVKALEGEAAIRGDGYVHVLDVFDYVNGMVSKDEPKQTPILKADDLDSNFRVALHNKYAEPKTKSINAIDKIREKIILEPLTGVKEFSNYLTLSNKLDTRNEVDLLFSEMTRITHEGDLFGWTNDLKAELRRSIFRLLKTCTELSKE